MVWFIVIAVAGWAVGYLTAKLLPCRAGTLRVDRSDPSEPAYLFLELSTDGMRRIQSHRTVTLTVRREDYLPRNEHPL